MASKLYHSNILQKELEWLEKVIAEEKVVEEKVEAQQKSGYHVDPEHKAIKKITLPKRRVVKRIRIKKKRKLK